MENQKRNEQQEYILRVRAGDEGAFAKLLADYTPLIEAQVAQYGKELGNQDREDLHQVACVAFYRAVLAFDIEQSEVELGLFAKICMTNALKTQSRAIYRRNPEVSADTVYDSFGEAAEDPARRVIEAERIEAMYRRVRRVLSDYENRVWSYYMAGHSTAGIAKLLNKPPHSIENAVYRIRQKLRREFADRDAQN